MKDENELPITNTMKKDKRNSTSQDDWKDYAYGGKSLLDDTEEEAEIIHLAQQKRQGIQT